MNDIIELDYKLLELDKKRDALFAQIKPLQDELMVLAEQRKTIVNEASILKTAEILLSGERDWPKLLNVLDDTLSDAYDKVLLDYSGIYPSGYYPNTNQRSFKIQFKRGAEDEIESVLTFLDIILPHMIPSVDDLIKIDIFEHDLNEFGCYYLDIHKNNPELFELSINRYGQESILKSFNNLRDALVYIQENHYYSDDTYQYKSTSTDDYDY